MGSFQAHFFDLPQLWLLGDEYECPSGPQYFVSIAKASKTAGVPNMVVGNFVVAEKRQPEQKLSFCSDLGKKNPNL